MSEKAFGGDYIRWKMHTDLARKAGTADPDLKRLATSRTEASRRQLAFVFAAGTLYAERMRRNQWRREKVIEMRRSMNPSLVEADLDPDSDVFDRPNLKQGPVPRWVVGTKEDVESGKAQETRETMFSRIRIPSLAWRMMEQVGLVGKARRVDGWSELTHLNLAAAEEVNDRQAQATGDRKPPISYELD